MRIESNIKGKAELSNVEDDPSFYTSNNGCEDNPQGAEGIPINDEDYISNRAE
jgi:hypothetical protein